MSFDAVAYCIVVAIILVFDLDMTRPDQALVYRRSRSPDHDRHPRRRSRSLQPHDRRSHHKRRRSSPPLPPVLPFRVPQLSKRDLETYKSLFTSYLDIQKQLRYQDISEGEVRGRWKSFVGKWYENTMLSCTDQSPPSFYEDPG